jgi:hypothetical protein
MNPPITRKIRQPAPPVRTQDPPQSQSGETAASAYPQRRAASAQKGMTVPFRTAALFAAAITILMFIVYSQMELSQLSRNNQRSAVELQSLIKEEGVLNRQFVAGISLNEVEAYAIGELGMVKPSKEQIVYIGIPAQDRAEVIRHPGFFGSVKNLFANAGARVIEIFD